MAGRLRRVPCPRRARRRRPRRARRDRPLARAGRRGAQRVHARRYRLHCEAGEPASGGAVRVHARDLPPPPRRARPGRRLDGPGAAAARADSPRAPSTATRSTWRSPRSWAATSTPRRASAQRMQDLGRRFGDDTLVALGVFFEGRALVKQARVARGPGAARRGDARRALRPPEADVDRAPSTAGCSTRATSSSTCGARASGPRRPAAGARRCRWRRCIPASAGAPRRDAAVHGAWDEAEAEALARAATWPASTCSSSPTATTRSARSGAAAATSPAPRRPTPRPTSWAATRSRGSRCCASRRVGSTRPRSSIAAALAAFRGSRLERAPAARRAGRDRAAPPAISTSPRSRPPRSSTPRRRSTAPACARSATGAGARSRSPGAKRSTALAALRVALGGWQELDAPTRPPAPGCCSPRPTRCSTTTTPRLASAPRPGPASSGSAPSPTCGASPASRRRRPAA